MRLLPVLKTAIYLDLQPAMAISIFSYRPYLETSAAMAALFGETSQFLRVHLAVLCRSVAFITADDDGHPDALAASPVTRSRPSSSPTLILLRDNLPTNVAYLVETVATVNTVDQDE
jgi:hypothetical protein